MISFIQKFLKDALGLLTDNQKAEFKKAVGDEQAIPPKVVIIGKAGVGKTTTVNNLFNASFKVSHSVAGTSEAQLKAVELAGGGKLDVIDMPGLGECIESDAVYEKIYREILPTADVVLYIIQANERVLAEDQRILEEVVLDSAADLGERIVIGLNQVDKIGPGRWNIRLNLPSPEQERSIERKCVDIIRKLSEMTGITREHISYYSAVQRYRLYDLLAAVVNASGNLGWKMPVQPRDWAELAEPDVLEFILKKRGGNHHAESV